MRSRLALTLVFVTSAAVLVLEILAARLLAPYVGDTLETYSAIIATVLAGISAGAYAGGRAADRFDPARLVGPVLVVGGALAVLTVPLVRLLGPGTAATGVDVLVVTAATFLVPAAVLSATTPLVVKLQLRELAETGEVVGRVSAVGTAGAIAGTLLAGFVLVEVAATSTAVYGVGGGIAVLGLVVSLATGTARKPHAALLVLPLGLAAVGVVAETAAGAVCHVETTYHCARIEVDEDRPSGRLLLLDTLRHSYVDLEDPTHLEFRYIRAFAAAVETLAPAGGLDTVHVGGGALTMARWLAAERPGSSSTVLEIDRRLVETVRRELGGIPARTEVRVGDARTSLAELPAGSADVVFGDAFGDLAVPWHLTTVEAARDIARVLRPGGVYLVNLIDYPPLRFARAEAATLAETFDEVAVVALEETAERRGGGNVVLIGLREPSIPGALAALGERVGAGEVLLEGGALRGWVGGADPLRDDHAPVDQWLARADAGGS